jgi:hypothetical protein
MDFMGKVVIERFYSQNICFFVSMRHVDVSLLEGKEKFVSFVIVGSFLSSEGEILSLSCYNYRVENDSRGLDI